MTTPDDSARTDASSQAAENPASPQPDGRTEDRPFWPRFRLLILRIVAVMGAVGVFAIVCTAGAGWYTSRPEFCNSCHIMEPYYVSWQESSHKDVSCIKCHFPPGVAEKARGKMLGLVQLVTYVTASQGTRPVAEIPDESCLRSGCHETRLLSGRLDFHGIPFDHAVHLQDMPREKQLHCTSCHSQIVQGAHMTVTTSTCFLCHFKDEFFNEGLGTCTRCHQIPEEEIDLGNGVTFHHDLSYEQGVDCASCHGDLIRGNGEVPPERCTVCHNREDDLQRIDDHFFLHQVHVTDHNVDCLSCHLTIHHSLDPHKIENAAGDCASCHRNPHQAQVELLLGRGSEILGERPSGKALARIACQTCHRVEHVSSTGAVLFEATLETCSSCHDADEVVQLEAYHVQLQDSLPALVEAVSQAEAAVEAADLPADRKATIQLALQKVKADVEFLRVANGIHNLHYASTVTRGVVEEISDVCRQLNIAMPEVTLPEVRGDEAAPSDAVAESPEDDEYGRVPPREAETPGEDDDVAPDTPVVEQDAGDGAAPSYDPVTGHSDRDRS